MHTPHVFEIPVSGPIDAERADREAIVGLHLSGHSQPLIVLRTWPTEVANMRRLAGHLGPDQPIYLISPPSGEHKRDFPSSVAGWVEHFLPRVQALDLSDPLRLAGFSFGGVVALGVCDALAHQGREVGRLLMFDAQLPTRHPEGFLQKLVFHLDRALPLDRTARREYVRKRLRAMRKHRARKTAGSRKLTPLERAIWVPYLKFLPGEYSTPVSLFWTADSRAYMMRDASLGWSRYLRGPFEAHEIPGSHLTLFDEPHVEELATSVRDALRPTDAAAARSHPEARVLP